jgi:uncharacterized membrane protein YfcA
MRRAIAAFSDFTAKGFSGSIRSWRDVDLRRLLVPVLLFTASLVLVSLYAWLLDSFGLFVTGASTAGLFAVLFSATLSSIAGFAFSAICAAMLLPLMPEPVQVVRILLLSSIAIQSLSVWTLRRAIDWQALLRFLAGGMIGLPGGVYLLLHIPASTFVHLLGIFLVLYGAYTLFRKPTTVRGRPLYDVLVGVTGGITGGLAAFPGAAVTIWCSMQGWDKDRQRGVCQPFILTMQLAALLLLQGMRPATTGPVTGMTAWTFVPAALAGTCCGLAIFKRITDRQFSTVVKLLLIASGLGMAF